MAWFKCKHPFNMLVVVKEQTKVQKDADFYHIDYHLRCVKCGEELTLKHATFVGGAKEFLERK